MSKTQFEDYPPEFDLSERDLQRYRILQIWAAFHSPELRPALYREWRSGYRSFPAWVSQKVYAQNRAKRTPSRRIGGSTRRPHWSKQYADELTASPALQEALAVGVNEVFRKAGLSGQETAIFTRLCDGLEPSEVVKELNLSWGNYWNLRSRALDKFKKAFVVAIRVISAGELTPREEA